MGNPCALDLDTRPVLSAMDESSKDRLIMDQWEELQRLREENRQLKTSLAGSKKSPKTSHNSSIPPSKDQKKATEDRPPKTRSRHHHAGGRDLHPNPDHRVHLQACPDCQNVLADLTLQGIYDKLELPEIRPVVTQIYRYKGHCPCCQKDVLAGVPEALKDLGAFDPSVQALACYFHFEHAISYSRLSRLFGEVFGLAISEGSLAKLFQKCRKPFERQAEAILALLCSGAFIGSDETSARVKGRTQWEWVFQNTQACLHVIRPSRGSEVKEDVLKGFWPETWVSDLLGSQRNHGSEKWQVCLSHQLRDCQFGIDSGDAVFSVPMKTLLKDALAARDLAPEQKHDQLQAFKTRLADLLDLFVEHPDGVRLQTRFGQIQENLFVFLEDETIPATNNASEQALRMSTIFRKVTNGFRSDWGRDLYAQVRSVINTGKRHGLTSYQAIFRALAPTPT